jgi:hypothetical protein
MPDSPELVVRAVRKKRIAQPLREGKVTTAHFHPLLLVAYLLLDL